MSRDYKHSLHQETEQGTGPNALMTFAGGLIVGLLFTAVYFLLFNEPPNTSQDTSEEETLAEEEIVTVEPEPEKIDLNELKQESTAEEPVYEFYKILPNIQVNVSEWEAPEPPSPTATTNNPAAEKNAPGIVYVLQVGAFKKIQTADRVKAELALLGVTANIQRTVINGQDIFHRVRVGPYKDISKMEQTKTKLRKNNIEFKVLKLSITQ